MVDEGRRLTDDEHAHDNDEYHGDVLLVPALAHLRPSSLPMLERLDQLHVEEGDEQQRSAMDDDEVEDVGVDDAVQPVAAERADLEHFACRVDRDAHFDALVLEEPLPPTTSRTRHNWT